MTDKEYRANPAISRSDLWKLRRSPEIFKYSLDFPDEPTDALLFGQVFHKYVLEPDTFGDEFAVEPDCDRRTKEGKAVYELFLKEAEGKTIVSRAMMLQAAQMGNAVLNNETAAKLLNGEHEKEFFWTDAATKEKCKCRVDVLKKTKDNLVIVDLKTCADASTETFQREAIKYGYDFQAAMYSEGVYKKTKRKPKFCFIAVEKKPPYAVNIFLADDNFIEHGVNIFRELITLYHSCKQTGNWYGYNGERNTINTLTLPAWLNTENT